MKTRKKELQARDILGDDMGRTGEFLTKTQLNEKYGKGHEIVYFWSEDQETGKSFGDREKIQQDTLRFTRDTGGKLFTGIHSENDWSKPKWWAAGWNLVNRTGDYVVVVDLSKLPSIVTGPATLRRYGRALYDIRRSRKAKSTAGLQGVR